MMQICKPLSNPLSNMYEWADDKDAKSGWKE